MFKLVYENRAKGAYKTIIYDGLTSVLETYDLALTLDAKKDELSIYYTGDVDLIARGKLCAVLSRDKCDICALVEHLNGGFFAVFKDGKIIKGFADIDALRECLFDDGYLYTIYEF